MESPSQEQRLRDSGDYNAAKAAFVFRQPIGRIGRTAEIDALVLHTFSADSVYTNGAAHVIDSGLSNT